MGDLGDDLGAKLREGKGGRGNLPTYNIDLGDDPMRTRRGRIAGRIADYLVQEFDVGKRP